VCDEEETAKAGSEVELARRPLLARRSPYTEN
jgi:hypothetical protein